MPKIYGNLVAYYIAKNSANEDAIKWFLGESVGKHVILEEIIETDTKKFLGLEQAIDIATNNNGALITNEAYKIDDKVRPLTMLLQARARFIGVDWAPLYKQVSTLHFLRLLTKIAEKKGDEHASRIKAGQKRATTAGKTIGNRKGTKNMDGAHGANKARWREYRMKLYPEVMRLREEHGTNTITELCGLLEERKIPTFTGKFKWYPSVVRDIIYEGNKNAE